MRQNSKVLLLIYHLVGEKGLVYFFFIFFSASKTCNHYFEMYFVRKPQWLCCLGLECPFERGREREKEKKREKILKPKKHSL
jgi:hypothetical protein